MAMKCICHFYCLFIWVWMHVAKAAAEPPAIFIFGDSTVDVGTNNYIRECSARADFLFNGIDYPFSEPTGRFSNGYNSADQIVMQFGYNKSPESYFHLLNYSSTFKSSILRGVNFASGGSGILKNTGQQKFNKVISLEEQIQQFSTVRENLTQILLTEATDTLLSKSLFLISVGSNDIFDYQDSPDGLSGEEFLGSLISTYRIHLKNLYDLGARKFGIVSIPPVGCCPAVRVFNDSNCVEPANDLAWAFYPATEALLQNLTLSDCPEMKYALGNAFEMTMAIIDNAYALGFKDISTACCGRGRLNAEDQCNQSATLCPNRLDYLFWDRFHPTQRVVKLAAATLYGGSRKFVTPMNFSQLAETDA